VSHPHGPPPEELERRRSAGRINGRDVTPAVGRRGEPGRWRRAVEGAAVALQRRGWEDSRWSFLYDKGTRYAERAGNGTVAAAARRMRDGAEVPPGVHGPMIHAPVWTWEVPLYFWFGGIATGSSFVALACDVTGDHRSAAIARRVTLAAVAPSPALLVLDLGRPLRFLHMMRIFKPRSAMSMGAWCLVGFSNTAAGAVGADLLGRRRLAGALGAATALFGTYLGSYTGVLLAATAVPVWARSRAFLPAIFMCTASATGAAANRLVLAATGRPPEHPSRRALGAVETGAMTAELVLSAVNERRLGRFGAALEEGRPGRLLPFAKAAVVTGLALRGAGRRAPWTAHVSSALFLTAGLAFRFAWVSAGPISSDDDDAVALMARTKMRDVAPEAA
jgi:Polysulphide reductase, NrfD